MPEQLTVEDLLDRWRMLSERNVEANLDELTAGASEDVKREVARRIADIEAAREALDGIWDDADELIVIPRGAPGRYVEPEQFDRGGMGLLYTAMDIELNRKVAYKLMKPVGPKDLDRREQFRNEAKITASLRHPGIVPIFGFVNDESGGPAYAMELIDAPSLAEAIRDLRTLPAGDARETRVRKLLRHFGAACRIAAYAHDKRIVHGDIKPLNILADVEFGATWLIDWGLARVIGDQDDAPVNPSAGTEAFRGPSAVDGSPASFSSDIHALGVTLALIVSEPSEHPNQLRPAHDLPRSLWAIGLKAMHPERERRYRSANELADDVENAVSDRPVSAYRDPRTTQIRRWFGRHKLAAAAAATLGLFIAGAIVASALISGARAREALKASEALRLREAAIRTKAEAYYTVAGYIYKALLQPKRDSAEVKGELVRSLLSVLEDRDKDPSQVTRTARAYLDSINQMDAEEKQDREASREKIINQVHEGVGIFEDLIKEYPNNRDYRVALGKYYLILAQVDTQLVTNLAGYEAMQRGGIPSADKLKLEATLARYDKAQAALPPDAPDVHSDWFQCSLGRALTLMQLGRYSESLLAWDQVVAFADPTERERWSAYRNVLVPAAEEEQSHMPWSSGPHTDHAKAVRMADALAAHEGVSAAAIYNAACALSLASVDEAADPGERHNRLERAIGYLERIATAGYFKRKPSGLLGFFAGKDTIQELLTDPDLNPLHERVEFKALIDRVTRNPAPAPAATAR